MKVFAFDEVVSSIHILTVRSIELDSELKKEAVDLLAA